MPGPGQAQNNFNASADVSKELNLLESGSTNVQRGNLLTLPLGGGLVYVQPVYVKSSGSTSFPLPKKVLVAFGDQVGFANTLDEALDQVFGGNSGASAGDAEKTSTVPPAVRPTRAILPVPVGMPPLTVLPEPTVLTRHLDRIPTMTAVPAILAVPAR